MFVYINLRIYSIDIVEIEGSGLQDALGGLSIVQISDLHAGRTGAFGVELAERINELNPDLMFITGDIIADTTAIPEAVDIISCLQASRGIFYVPGNYDHYYERRGKPDLIFEGLKNAGVNILRNESVLGTVINEDYSHSEFYIAGIDDRVTFHDDLRLTLSGLTPGIPVLLLSHTPIVLRDAAEKNVNMILSGHTHGGQIYVPFLTRQVTKSYYIGSYLKGLHSKDNTRIFINRGLGTSIIPVRFFARPQIAVLKFV
jgi:predicted MPP superfamily phosphohydrolase